MIRRRIAGAGDPHSAGALRRRVRVRCRVAPRSRRDGTTRLHIVGRHQTAFEIPWLSRSRWAVVRTATEASAVAPSLMVWVQVWAVAWALRHRGPCHRSRHRLTLSRWYFHLMLAGMPHVALLDGAQQHSPGSRQWSADQPIADPRACCRLSAPGDRQPRSWSLHLRPGLPRLLQRVQRFVACRRWTPEFASLVILPTVNAPFDQVPPGHRRRGGFAVACDQRCYRGLLRGFHYVDDLLR